MKREKFTGILAGVLLCGLLVAPRGNSQEKSDVRHQIADAYGLASWGQVEEIKYTFNVDAGKVKVARTWTWEPKADRVTFEGKDKDGKPVKVTYTHGQMTPDMVKDVDPNFINDQYWLIFPFHLVWDKDVDVEDKGMTAAPMGKGKLRKVTVTYPKKGGGYTPGDSYDLFVGTDNRIVEWIFHRGGAAKPTLTASWADYKQAGPISIAQDHRGVYEGKPTRIFFSDVSVKVAGAK